MSRKITVTNHNEPKPTGAKWRLDGRDYVVIYPGRKSFDPNNYSHFSSLTNARANARALVQEGKPWAEIHRYWENGTMIQSAFISEYEVEVETGSAVK